MNQISTFGFVVLCLICVASCGGGGKQTIHGTLTLNESDNIWKHGGPCSGSGGYKDIDQGSQVTVKNEKGEVIATTNLQSGVGQDLLVALEEAAAALQSRTPQPVTTIGSILGTSFVECKFPFELAVADASFYSIEVSHRGAITYSREDLQKNDWAAELTLGK